MSEKACGCGGGSAFEAGFHTFEGKRIPLLPTRLTSADRIGDVLVRLDIGRSRYSVNPGIYAVGSPDADSGVFVTANYKLTVDSLRKELSGVDAWILVLDTRGINVWCAAGKGTFGTKELVARIAEIGLDKLVRHRTLILPQLGASGVSAPAVQKISGFRVVYGPVRARDITAFISNGMKKDDSMRQVRFFFGDRMSVSGVELAHSWPFFTAMLVFAGIFALPLGTAYFHRLWDRFLPLAASVLIGTLAFPALLPVLPSRAFSIKGAILGVGWAVAAALIWGMDAAQAVGTALIIAPVVSFIAMNFTGSSTFTSQTGAEAEVRWGLIPMAVCLILGLAVSAISRFAAV